LKNKLAYSLRQPSPFDPRFIKFGPIRRGLVGRTLALGALIARRLAALRSTVLLFGLSRLLAIVLTRIGLLILRFARLSAGTAGGRLPLLLLLSLLKQSVERLDDILLDALRADAGILRLAKPLRSRLHPINSSLHEIVEGCTIKRSLEPLRLLPLGCIVGT